jgi:hypothetical protein
MEQADNLPFRVKRRRFFLEGADEPHPAQEVDEVRRVFLNHEAMRH